MSPRIKVANILLAQKGIEIPVETAALMKAASRLVSDLDPKFANLFSLDKAKQEFTESDWMTIEEYSVSAEFVNN